jgi:hypothetical protein
MAGVGEDIIVELGLIISQDAKVGNIKEMEND